MRRPEKRGEETLLYDTLLELVFVAVIALVFLSVASFVRDDTLHQQRVIARDFALVHDAALAAPGGLQYHFPVAQGFALTVDAQCHVQVQSVAKRAQLAEGYLCAVSANPRLSVQEEKGGVAQEYGLVYAEQ